jgi:hypothetical protein
VQSPRAVNRRVTEGLLTVRKLISVEYMGRFMDFEQRALLDKGTGSGTPAAGNGGFVENRKPRFIAGSWPQ